MAGATDNKIEARVADALFKTLRRSCGARRIIRGEEERHKYDNVLIVASGTGINLRVLARSAIREQQRHSA